MFVVTVLAWFVVMRGTASHFVGAAGFFGRLDPRDVGSASSMDRASEEMLPDDFYGRARMGGVWVLVLAPVMFFTGLAGPHGEGGGGIAYASMIVLALLSAPLGLITTITGVSCRPGSPGRRVVRLYAVICTAVLAVAWFVP